MEEMVFQIGPIRPPSEANSLLLRVTVNCPWNRCKFCMLYKKYDFHTRSVAEVKKISTPWRNCVTPYFAV